MDCFNTYDFDKIQKLLDWWYINYKIISFNEGWKIKQAFNMFLPVKSRIRKYGNDTPMVFQINVLEELYPPIDYYSNFETYFKKAGEDAEKYGWIIDDDNVIIDFNIDIFESSKHLLTGYELGLF